MRGGEGRAATQIIAAARPQGEETGERGEVYGERGILGMRNLLQWVVVCEF